MAVRSRSFVSIISSPRKDNGEDKRCHDDHDCSVGLCQQPVKRATWILDATISTCCHGYCNQFLPWCRVDARASTWDQLPNWCRGINCATLMPQYQLGSRINLLPWLRQHVSTMVSTCFNPHQDHSLLAPPCTRCCASHMLIMKMLAASNDDNAELGLYTWRHWKTGRSQNVIMLVSPAFAECGPQMQIVLSCKFHF